MMINQRNASRNGIAIGSQFSRKVDRGNLQRRYCIEALETRRLMAVDIGLVTMADLSTQSDTGNGYSTFASDHTISDDGRFTIFSSRSTDLVAGDTNQKLDIFLRDLTLGTTTLVTRNYAGTGSANGDSVEGAISGDGSKIVFASDATDLVSGMETGSHGLNLYLYDIAGRTVSLITKNVLTGTADAATSQSASISRDGSKIAFESTSTQLVAGTADRNWTVDVYLYDSINDTISLVSKSIYGNETGNKGSNLPQISADGNKIVFTSYATNLVDGVTDENGGADVFLYDVAGRAVSLVSKSVTGNKTANMGCRLPKISGDGSKVVFTSRSTDLVAGVMDGAGYDGFLYDATSGVVSLITKTTTPNQAADSVADLRISLDGSKAVFASGSTNIVVGISDTNHSYDVFLYDVVSQSVSLVSKSFLPGRAGNNYSDVPQISADGSKVTFASTSSDLVSGIANVTIGGFNAYLYDVASGAMSLLSKSAKENQTGDGESAAPQMSADGSTVLLFSDATDLVGAFVDANDTHDLYAYRAGTGTQLVTVRHTALAMGHAGVGKLADSAESVSRDGRYVVFESQDGSIVAGDHNHKRDIFLRDLLTGTATLVSHNSSGTGSGNGDSLHGRISADGSKIVFESLARDLVAGISDDNSTYDIFLYDVATGVVSLVSTSAGWYRTANSVSYDAHLSDDGSKVVFSSEASDLALADSASTSDVFIYDVPSATLSLISQSTAGRQTANASSFSPRISGDGNKVAFTSYATDLVSGLTDDNSLLDLFLYDVAGGAITLVSKSASSGQTTNGDVSEAHLSVDGSKLVFYATSTDLVSGVTKSSGSFDVFLYDAAHDSMTLVSKSTLGGQAGNESSSDPQISRDGSTIVFSSYATDLVGDVFKASAFEDIFRYDVATGSLSLISHSTIAGRAGNASSRNAQVSDDGSRIVFASGATDLVAGIMDKNTADSFGGEDVFVYNTRSAITSLVSESVVDNQTGDFSSQRPVISGNGESALFYSHATDLVTNVVHFGPLGESDDGEIYAVKLDLPPPPRIELLAFGAEAGAKPRVKVIDAVSGNVVASFLAYASSFRGGVRVAMADMNRDGRAEIVVAPGKGLSALIKVFDLTGHELTNFRTTAYAGFRGGVFVAVGDVNGDGRPDLITSPDSGLSAQIKVFKNRVGVNSPNLDPISNSPLYAFLAFGGSFKGGATVAAGDLTRDGKAEVVVGNGPGMGPRVRTFDLADATRYAPGAKIKALPFAREIRPFNSGDRGGVFVAVGNVRADATAEIIIGNGVDGRGRVEMYFANGGRFESVTAYGNDDGRNAPVHVATKNVDADSLDEIITGQGRPGSSRRWRSFDSDATLIDNILAADEDFKFGFYVA